MSPSSSTPKPLHPEHLTWTALLGHWMKFAQAAVALPKDGDGPRWRASVAPVITLQAVTCALGDLDQLPPDEQALAFDRAEILINAAMSDLDRVWPSTGPPSSLADLTADATRALAAARRVQTTGQPPT